MYMHLTIFSGVQNYDSSLKMEAPCPPPSETLVTYITTPRHIPEDRGISVPWEPQISHQNYSCLLAHASLVA